MDYIANELGHATNTSLSWEQQHSCKDGVRFQIKTSLQQRISKAKARSGLAWHRPSIRLACPASTCYQPGKEPSTTGSHLPVLPGRHFLSITRTLNLQCKPQCKPQGMKSCKNGVRAKPNKEIVLIQSGNIRKKSDNLVAVVVVGRLVNPDSHQKQILVIRRNAKNGEGGSRSRI